MYSSVKLDMYNWVTLWYVQFSGTWFIQFSETWNVRFRSNLYEQFGKTLAYTIQLNLVLATKTQCRSIHFLALHKKMISLSTTSTTITSLTATTTTTTTSAATTTTRRRTKTRCKQVFPPPKILLPIKNTFFHEFVECVETSPTDWQGKLFWNKRVVQCDLIWRNFTTLTIN